MPSDKIKVYRVYFAYGYFVYDRNANFMESVSTKRSKHLAR